MVKQHTDKTTNLIKSMPKDLTLLALENMQLIQQDFKEDHPTAM